MSTIIEFDGTKWPLYGLRVILDILLHPLEYAKVLIQIGHEPIPPTPATTLLGSPALQLPNTIQYINHIKSVDGLWGLYRGLGPKLCGNLISVVTTQKVVKYLELTAEPAGGEALDMEEKRRRQFVQNLRGDIITHTTAIVISHPFHVVTIRIMGQFVGKETKYNGPLASIEEIYHENGVFGFYSGIVPRLLGDLLSVLLASCLTYAVNKYLIREKELRNCTQAVMNMVSSSIMYPFQVVSSCMIVSNSGLKAGSPPFMPHYNSWIDCWTDLSAMNQLKRGSSHFFRYYRGPAFKEIM